MVEGSNPGGIEPRTLGVVHDRSMTVDVLDSVPTAKKIPGVLTEKRRAWTPEI